MERPVHKTIVVSAVNLRKGGTLTILRDCLKYLSENYSADNRVIALVHDRRLCEYHGIEYMGFPDTVKSWGRRLWCEYVTMNKVSKQIAAEDGQKAWMWLSLHDTTPRVQAEHREVYCHTSFPFLKVKLRDFWMDPKIPLFAMFTRLAYRINVHKNDYLIVQQQWFKEAMCQMLNVSEEKVRVIAPTMADVPSVSESLVDEVRNSYDGKPIFFYASTADCHKNFETLCEAAKLLEGKIGKNKFKVVLTISGGENRYAKWLYKKWGDVDSIDFHGFMSKEDLFAYYKAATCFVFPSRVETWGLPISEYIASANKSLILADLPYAHETSMGGNDVTFFDVTNAFELQSLLESNL